VRIYVLLSFETWNDSFAFIHSFHGLQDTPSGQICSGDVQLSNKHSLALTNVTLLSQHTDVPIQFSSEDKTEHLRVISIQDISGTSLLFLANNFREAELLFCGLKLLLERETARFGVRGGLAITALGGKVAEGAMSPAAPCLRRLRVDSKNCIHLTSLL
jgi:hypothetical protein